MTDIDDLAATDEPSSTLRRWPPTVSQPALLVQEGDIAADYLERLLDIIDYDGDIDLDVENDRAVVAIVGTTCSAGRRHGETLDALQELTRLAVSRRPAPAAG